MKRILLDECIPRPLAQYLPDYYVRTAPQMGWASIANGALLKLAEVEFEVFITVDKGFRYEQSLRSTALGLVVLRVRSNRLEDLLPLVPDLLTALTTIKAGDMIQLGG